MAQSKFSKKKVGDRCAKCGTTNKIQLDHIIALCLGGLDERSNLQILCYDCHLAKTKQEISKYWARKTDEEMAEWSRRSSENNRNLSPEAAQRKSVAASRAQKGKPKSEETKRKISETKRNRSAEARQQRLDRFRAALAARTEERQQEVIQRMSDALTGRKLPDSHRDAITRALHRRTQEEWDIINAKKQETRLKNKALRDSTNGHKQT